jgi:streptogramin lyase
MVDVTDTQRRGLSRRARLYLAVIAATTVGLVAPAVSSATTISEFSAGISAGAGVEGIAPGPDGNLWFTEEGKHQVGRITPAGVITEFSTGISGGTGEITAGPDHKLWFSEFSANKIGTITPSGVVTEFSLPASSEPIGITAGPDGNVWFVERGTSMIGRITPSGTITEFPTPTASAEPEGIALGPDGNLWFTERGINRIGRMTPAGASTDFSAGITPGGDVSAITAGPDGNVWFTEPTTQRIGRITPAGVVTEFPVGLGTNGVAAGPDGNLWYTTYGAENAIGRITPAGVATTFSGLSSSGGGIAAGPDGNLWFTEYEANKIGRATVDGPLAITGLASAIMPTSATLAGSIDPRGASVPTSYHFDYGTTTAYGQSTPSQTLLGGSPNTVTATLSGLTPSTVYHYRLVASNATGMSAGADQSLTTAAAPAAKLPPVAPVITKAAQSRVTWRAGNKLAQISRSKHRKTPVGTTFSFSLNEQAAVSFSFTERIGGRKVKGKCVAQSRKNRRRHACKRTVTAARLSFAGHAGINKVAFQGRISRSKKLAPGRYTLVITATNSAGQKSAPQTLTFTIVR